MRDIETAAREAGLDYPLGDLGRRARWKKAPTPTGGPTSFELAIGTI